MTLGQLISLFIAAMFTGAIIVIGAYLFVLLLMVRSAVKNRYGGIFFEKNGWVTLEGAKVRHEKSGDFFDDQYGGAYRIDQRRQLFVRWPPFAPSFLQEPITAGIYMRADPNPQTEELNDEATATAALIAAVEEYLASADEDDEQAAVFGNALLRLEESVPLGSPLELRRRFGIEDDPHSPNFYTALATRHIQSENVAKSLVEGADREVAGATPKGNLLLIILIGASILVGVFGMIQSGRAAGALQKSMNGIQQTLGGIEQLVGHSTTTTPAK